jgi:hypothetical protein
VSDLTYVATWRGFMYVAFVIDAFSRRIVGWRVSSSVTSDLALDALDQAISERQEASDEGLIHHSGRGAQYLSIRYIAAGESRTIREFLDAAFGYVGLDWQKYVRHDPRYHRPTEVDHLRGDPRLARERLGWRPRVSFEQLVHMMVDADVELAKQERTLAEAGHAAALRGMAST